MSTQSDDDLTLPSVVASLPGEYRQRRLLLTIIFHPVTSRIGEFAELPVTAEPAPAILGRGTPTFARPPGNSAGAPLDDRHVSRQAVSLVANGQEVLINKLPDSSRCRVDGRELRESVQLAPAQLERGVPILLGHSVVLLLRHALVADLPEAAAPCAQLRGSSGYMADLRAQILRAADSDLDVLIRGETGTGKELVANAIHRASRRNQGPMVSVNMAAVSPGLAAASLFGSARGAFTGATRASVGYFAQAQGGSLFLDEIGDTPAEVQPQLLRALQEREIQEVGGAVRRVDVRVISATDAALEAPACDFNSALRHRLGRCEIHVLPLREHPEDIGELLLHFLSTSCQQAEAACALPGAGSSARDIAVWAELFHSFLRYRWPGNVRELANFASQVVVASVRKLALPEHIRKALSEGGQSSEEESDNTRVKANGAPRRRLRDIDQAEFDRALEAGDFEVANVARQLGVSRPSVYRRMHGARQYRLAGQVSLDELERALAAHGGDSRAAALDLKVSVNGLRSRLRDSALEWF